MPSGEISSLRQHHAVRKYVPMDLNTDNRSAPFRGRAHGYDFRVQISKEQDLTEVAGIGLRKLFAETFDQSPNLHNQISNFACTDWRSKVRSMGKI
jgi:hypothetical protein